MMDDPARQRRRAAWRVWVLGAMALGVAACDKNPVFRIGDRRVELPRFMLLPPPRPVPVPPEVITPPVVAAPPPGAATVASNQPPGDFGRAEPVPWSGSAAWNEYPPERNPPFAEAPSTLPPVQAGPGIFAEPLDDLPPSSPPRRAAAPAPADQSGGASAQLRRNPWIARFWSQLSGTQRSQVAGRLQLGQAEAAREWDRMGLGDRLRLLYGEGAGA